MQLSLFGPVEAGPEPKPKDDRATRLRILVTVKAPPRPSRKYGETVCVAGLRVDTLNPTWVRLYPINFRRLAHHDRFDKYDIISLDAKPARQDQRRESWKPILERISRERHLSTWASRRALLDPRVEDSMCRLYRHVRQRPDAPSLALVRPKEIRALAITPHQGWTAAEQRKIDAYVSQAELFDDSPRTPPLAPRFAAMYRYRCYERGCKGHKQQIADGEFVAFQHRFAGHSDAALREALEAKFLGEMCAPSRDVAFYVGNQAKRVHIFSVLGVYWPKR